MSASVSANGPVLGGELVADLLLEGLQADRGQGVVLPLGFCLAALTRTRPMSATTSPPSVVREKWFLPVAELRQQRVLADNDPAEQEKLIKLNTLSANLVIFHNALDIMDVIRSLIV
ncbi:hypothetical protein ABZ801_33400 [Actinomadura sp. NPDC047616]|uniref:hypothetical protein n=1 Tax=Actinomadura sp. NPDC047616 TaxID=3155914 RepID=UPI0033D8B88F